ncbi:MAG: phosphoglycerate mutase [Proteobacteria bacterium]|nr:phosphoglycerate mutase [Pseudomonadota bacterium]
MAVAACLLLPARDRFESMELDAALARTLGRGDRIDTGDDGRRAQLRRFVRMTPTHWSLAALSRQQDRGDAAASAWLRVDPVHVRPDINGARLLGWGDGLQLSQGEADAFLAALRPLFGDAGFALDATSPDRWYLRMVPGTPLPEFRDPAEALGTDLGDDIDTTPQHRHWRVLESEVQVVLHNHPMNQQRARRGLPPVNAVWCWGGGVLPQSVVRVDGWTLASRDPSVRILAQASGGSDELPQAWSMPDHDTAFDLHRVVKPEAIVSDWLSPAAEALRQGKLRLLVLDFADGLRWRLERKHKWRILRRPVQILR